MSFSGSVACRKGVHVRSLAIPRHHNYVEHSAGHLNLRRDGERYLSVSNETQDAGVSVLRELSKQPESISRATIDNVRLCQGLLVGVALFSAL